jgi:CubicO group peptidase (beta-lactamase class C family)
MKTKLIVVAGLIFLFSITLKSQKKSDAISTHQFGEVRNEILRNLKGGDFTSVAIAVAKDGKIIWEEAFGYSNKEKNVKATVNSMYAIASISKPFTATGIMILAQKGLIDINKPVNDYLGNVKLKVYDGKAKEVTVERVLKHESGLPDYVHFFYENDPWKIPPMDSTIKHYGIIVYPPGEVYQYSNIGYGILGYIIERLSGDTYPDFMKKEVFLPLGMNHSSVNIDDGLKEFITTKYDPNGNSLPFYEFDHPGGSAVLCSIHDLIRFGMFHLKNHFAGQQQILKDETIDRMHIQGSTDSPNPNYMLGWFVQPDDHGYLTISHGGGMPGVSSLLTLIPSENIAVAVVFNGGKKMNSSVITNSILSAMLPVWADRVKMEVPPGTIDLANLPLPKSVLGEWNGEISSYEGKIPVKMVFQDDGDIHVKLADQMETLLNNQKFRKGDILKGDFWGQINTSDTKQVPHYDIRVEMILRGNVLSGYAKSTNSINYGLASYIRLVKKE